MPNMGRYWKMTRYTSAGSMMRYTSQFFRKSCRHVIFLPGLIAGCTAVVCIYSASSAAPGM